MAKAPPQKDFVFSDDDDDEVEGGGIPDDHGMIYLKGTNGLADTGNTAKRKANAEKPRMVRRAVKRPPKRDPRGSQ
jgi:hypothetical protein